MTSAPACLFVLQAHPLWRWACALLAAACAASSVHWFGLQAEWAPLTAAGSAGVAAVLGGAWQAHRPTVQGVLGWDGQAWQLTTTSPRSRSTRAPDANAISRVTVDVSLDFNHWVLLHVRQQGGRRATWWLPVARSMAPTTWHPLRVALFAPSSPAALAR